ncbi:MAG: helix-turn-helix transcriptional regulator [Ruminococcus sp.]|nr:helix-turn-helix transcriptional regulator [Ruminococcus sp.]
MYNTADENIKEMCISTTNLLNNDYIKDYFLILKKYMDKRKELNISQVKISEISGISQRNLKRIENLQLIPKYNILDSLLRVVGLKLTVVSIEDNED